MAKPDFGFQFSPPVPPHIAPRYTTSAQQTLQVQHPTSTPGLSLEQPQLHSQQNPGQPRYTPRAPVPPQDVQPEATTIQQSDLHGTSKK